tara:strand:- start:1331 stop:1507 length:177 start_codon:yes stop_codon:yes gene_type:complete
MAVLSALNNSAVVRLKPAWEELSSTPRTRHQQLEKLMSYQHGLQFECSFGSSLLPSLL